MSAAGLASRRKMLLGVTFALLAQHPSLAQEARRVYRLGFVVQAIKPSLAAMFDELRLYGFSEGENLSPYENGFGVPVERLDEIAREVVNARPDVIYVGGAAAGRAVQQMTATIPLVVATDDMIREGLVSSLAHPGGNITGISILATELDGKRLELLSEMLPGVRRIAALADPGTTPPDQLDGLLTTARSHGVELSIYKAASPEEIGPALAAASAAGVQAIDIMASALFNANRRKVIALIAEAKLPAVYQWPEYGQEGALISYGPSIDGFYRQAARLIAKIFRGAKPADLPVEQPSRIALVINMKTAKALGLTVPPSLLARADEVIE
jgi:putative ABC transport system substrate-binding protein